MEMIWKRGNFKVAFYAVVERKHGTVAHPVKTAPVGWLFSSFVMLKADSHWGTKLSG
jgi:hypothetical protein